MSQSVVGPLGNGLKNAREERGNAMKRKLTLALVLSLTLGIAGLANAATYFDFKWLDISVTGTGTAVWSHDVTPDLTVPYDTVNLATLFITGYTDGGIFGAGAGSNDLVTVEQTFNLGSLYSLFGIVVDLSDVGQVFTAWGPGNGTFDVSLSYNQSPNHLVITSSTLAINYDNHTPPIPENSTMVLVGSGLVGFAAWGRKKFRKLT